MTDEKKLDAIKKAGKFYAEGIAYEFFAYEGEELWMMCGFGLKQFNLDQVYRVLK